MSNVHKIAVADQSHVNGKTEFSAELSFTPSSNPMANLANITLLLEKCLGVNIQIWFDEFSGKIRTNWNINGARDWTDNDTLALTARIQKDHGFTRLSDEVVWKALQLYTSTRKRDQVRDYFNSLKWDQIDRIQNLFTVCLGADDSYYTKAASKNFCISIAARTFEPGCQVDTAPILEGNQGTRKSTFLKVLAGPDWYCDCGEDVGTKDFKLLLQGILILELSELSSLSKSDAGKIKQILSCRSDRFRLPYAKLSEEFKRRCVFVGTTNETHYLKDDTGGRRFWPIKTGKIDIDYLKANRDQIFAEAVAKYKAGETWYEMPIETETVQESRRLEDPWIEVISDYLDGKNEITLKRVLCEGLNIPVDKIKAKEIRAAGILRSLGWCSEKKGTDRHRIWRPNE